MGRKHRQNVEVLILGYVIGLSLMYMVIQNIFGLFIHDVTEGVFTIIFVFSIILNAKTRDYHTYNALLLMCSLTLMDIFYNTSVLGVLTVIVGMLFILIWAKNDNYIKGEYQDNIFYIVVYIGLFIAGFVFDSYSIIFSVIYGIVGFLISLIRMLRYTTVSRVGNIFYWLLITSSLLYIGEISQVFIKAFFIIIIVIGNLAGSIGGKKMISKMKIV